jgi:hypothetical protein
MAWRVAILIDLSSMVVGRRRLALCPPEMNAVLESTGGAQRRVVLTIRDAHGELDAGQRGLEAVQEALGAEITGDASIESIQPDEELGRA